jgi:putative Flp pilus-assembly TadE/G-like protein
MRDLIIRLARPARRRLRRDDRGAIAVLVAVLVAGGVLLGAGALVIDVGEIYQNRAELQNGADAGALAVAKTCVLATCDPTVATSYADLNASQLTGGAAAVDLVCGTGIGPCLGTTGAITDCLPAPVGVDGYVDVHTSTLTSSGSTTLPPVFALGQRTTVRACSQAAWGPPAAARVTALTVSACAWGRATSNGTSYAPPVPPPAASFDQVLPLNGTGSQGCSGGPAGSPTAGDFGWTLGNGSCSQAVSGPRYSGGIGPVSAGCQNVLAAARANQTPIYIPVYTSVAADPDNDGDASTPVGSDDDFDQAVYTLDGFAVFVVTGYNLPTTDQGSPFFASDWLNPGNDCSGSTFCLNGYFTRGLIPSSGSIGGPDLGATIIRLSG